MASLSCLIMGFFPWETRSNPKWILDSLWQTGRGMLELTAVVAMAGFIIAIVTYTGVTFVIPIVLGELAGGNLPVLLVLVAVAGLILGMVNAAGGLLGVLLVGRECYLKRRPAETGPAVKA